VAALAAAVLADVLGTVFFTVTVAYVLVPVRARVVERGLSERTAAALVAVAAFALVVVALAPMGWVLYRRRRDLFVFLQSVPETVVVPVGEFSYTVDTSVVLEFLQESVRSLAVTGAAAAPVITLKLFLFAVLLYALLVRPGAAGRAVFGIVPPGYEDVVVALDRRVRETLYGIYVLQAATAAGTFLAALTVFWALGYDGSLTLAVIAGVLQFVPVLGPGVLVAVLAVIDLLGEEVGRALLVLVLGGALIGLAPDAVIRPRLASRAAKLPTGLYFIGFVGGLLTLGAVGFIAGPLVVAVLVEVVGLLEASEQEAATANAGAEGGPEPRMDETDGDRPERDGES
jgi:predicted PurR-regulated permease PerM